MTSTLYSTSMHNHVEPAFKLVFSLLCVAPMQMDSRLHADHLEQVMNTALTGISRVHSVLDRTVKEHLKKTVGNVDF